MLVTKGKKVLQPKRQRKKRRRVSRLMQHSAYGSRLNTTEDLAHCSRQRVHFPRRQNKMYDVRVMVDVFLRWCMDTNSFVWVYSYLKSAHVQRM